MDYPDHLNSGLGHPMSDIMVDTGARRRRNGGGPGGGCARMPVGTYLYLNAVGVDYHVAVPPWHGRGLNEVPGAAIREINGCKKTK
jgi:hypothetical protein